MRVFIAVVEDGSFTAAGKRLGLPKSSISRSLSALEHSLGVRLLQRSTRSLSLTDAGRAYFQQVRPALASLSESAASARARGTEPRGRIRISCPPDSDELIAAYVTRFLKKYPLVELEASFSSRHVDLVAEGFDLALRAGTLKDSSLVSRRILSTDLGVFAAPSYLRKRGTPRGLATLTEHDCIGMNAPSGRVTWTLQGPEGKEESVELHCSLTTDLMAFTVRMAVHGLGLALLPEVIGAGLAASDSLVRVLPDWRMVGPGLHVVSPSRAFEPLAVTLFKKGLIDELTRLDARRCSRAAQRLLGE